MPFCVYRRLRHKKRAPPSNSNISCKHSFPTTSSYAMPVFHLPDSVLVPHRSHSVLRDTHLPFMRGAHFPFPEEFQPLFAPRCPFLSIIDMNTHPGRKRLTLPPEPLLALNYITGITTPPKTTHFHYQVATAFFALPYPARNQPAHSLRSLHQPQALPIGWLS